MVTNKLRARRSADRACAGADRVWRCEGGEADKPAADGGKACGTFNLAVSPWVGYEANAAVVAYVATKDSAARW